jgi:hypothetical protein
MAAPSLPRALVSAAGRRTCRMERDMSGLIIVISAASTGCLPTTCCTAAPGKVLAGERGIARLPTPSVACVSRRLLVLATRIGRWRVVDLGAAVMLVSGGPGPLGIVRALWERSNLPCASWSGIINRPSIVGRSARQRTRESREVRRLTPIRLNYNASSRQIIQRVSGSEVGCSGSIGPYARPGRAWRAASWARCLGRGWARRCGGAC